MPDRPDPDRDQLMIRLRKHLDATGGAVVISSSRQGDYLAASEWGQEAPDSPMAGAAAYGMGATPCRALDDMLHEAGCP